MLLVGEPHFGNKSFRTGISKLCAQAKSGLLSLFVFLFFFSIYLFMFGCAESLLLLHFFPSCSKQGLLFVVVNGLLIAMVSLVETQALK